MIRGAALEGWIKNQLSLNEEPRYLNNEKMPNIFRQPFLEDIFIAVDVLKEKIPKEICQGHGSFFICSG